MPQIIIELAKLFGPMGFIMWLVFRTTNHTIPRLAKSFQESLDRQRTDFREICEKQREDFKDALNREHDVHGRQTDRVIDKIESMR